MSPTPGVTDGNSAPPAEGRSSSTGPSTKHTSPGAPNSRRDGPAAQYGRSFTRNARADGGVIHQLRAPQLGGKMTRTSRKTRLAALGAVLVLATTAMACSSTNSASTTTTAASSGGSGGSSGSKIPASAFSDHTGLTSDSVTVGNVSTLSLGCLLYTSPSPRDRTRSRMPS